MAIEALMSGAMLERFGAMQRLSAEGLEWGQRLLASDQATWTIAAALVALDDLYPFDQRMKAVMVQWQIRQIDGVDGINDHTDAVYDRSVLSALNTLHAEASPWFGRLAEGLPRLSQYDVRLTAALETALVGDGQFVAFPLVDSYHSVWFEMHEDLIRLAGRTREAEVAAGRA